MSFAYDELDDLTVEALAEALIAQKQNVLALKNVSGSGSLTIAEMSSSVLMAIV